MTDTPEIILETPRMRFRRLTMDDLEPLYALYKDPEMRQYYPEGTLTREETLEELEWFMNGHPRHPELGLWATIHKETGAFIGRCGLLPWKIEDRDEVEIAYMIDKRFWRQGLGTEAARGLLQYGFETLHLSRMVCMIEHGNDASVKVATNIGMTFEKASEDDKGPFLLYAIERAIERPDQTG